VNACADVAKIFTPMRNIKVFKTPPNLRRDGIPKSRRKQYTQPDNGEEVKITGKKPHPSRLRVGAGLGVLKSYCGKRCWKRKA